MRQDVYTYDALAWTLYKNKQCSEAQQATERALKMDTPEPSFYSHAGMIALDLGRKTGCCQISSASAEAESEIRPHRSANRAEEARRDIE